MLITLRGTKRNQVGAGVVWGEVWIRWELGLCGENQGTANIEVGECRIYICRKK